MRSCIRRSLPQTYSGERNEIVDLEKFIDKTSTKRETCTKLASNASLILGDLNILYEGKIVKGN